MALTQRLSQDILMVESAENGSASNCMAAETVAMSALRRLLSQCPPIFIGR
jgi:hypothetical protein